MTHVTQHRRLSALQATNPLRKKKTAVDLH